MRKSRSLVFCLAAASVCAVLAGQQQSPEQKCQVEVAFPKADAKVGGDDNVKGTARNLPRGAHLWVLAHRKGIGLWWPQGGGEANLERDGDWSVFVTYGQERDRGRQFEVVAVVVDDSTHANLSKWVTESERTAQYNGIAMPRIVGACEVKKVIVTRGE